MRRRLIDVYLAVWLASGVISTAGQLFRNSGIAEESHWVHSAGWQREVGLWHVLQGAMIVQALGTGSRPTKIMLVRAAVLLSIALGANHALALAAGGAGGLRIHVTSVVANVLNVAAATAVLFFERRAAPRAAGDSRVLTGDPA